MAEEEPTLRVDTTAIACPACGSVEKNIVKGDCLYMADAWHTGFPLKWSEPSDELHPTNVPMVFARHMNLMPYRSCCETLPGFAHSSHCGAHYFAEGQTVIKGEGWIRGPQNILMLPDNTRYRLKEDTVSSDRTFENETRPH